MAACLHHFTGGPCFSRNLGSPRRPLFWCSTRPFPVRDTTARKHENHTSTIPCLIGISKWEAIVDQFVEHSKASFHLLLSQNLFSSHSVAVACRRPTISLICSDSSTSPRSTDCDALCRGRSRLSPDPDPDVYVRTQISPLHFSRPTSSVFLSISTSCLPSTPASDCLLSPIPPYRNLTRRFPTGQ